MIAIMTDDPFTHIPESGLRPFAIAAGQLLFRRDDPPRELFRVDAGRVALQRVTEDGQRVTIAQAGPGETLAEASLFADNYHCDAIALTDVRGVAVDKAVVRQHLRSDADFAEALVRRLALHLRNERQRAEIMSIRSARERTFAALACFGQSGTITAFAASIGLTQEACSRALAGLVSEGRVVRLGRGRYACRGVTTR